MKIDSELAKEIKALNGDGSREARFKTLEKVKAAAADFSTPEVRGKFNELLSKHGRAVTAICVASTLSQRRERLDWWGLRWALEVINLWTNRTPAFLERACIYDGLHPTRICEYAEAFINLTIEEGENT